MQKLSAITDGLSNTLLVAEFAGRPDHWILGVKQPTNATLLWANWWGPWASFMSSIFITWSADGTNAPRWPMHNQLQQQLGHLRLSPHRGQYPALRRLGPIRQGHARP